MGARAVVQYEVLLQLEAFADDGVPRLLGAFSNIETEADRVAQNAFEAYGQLPGERDMGDFADSAGDQGIAYYQTLSQLKQAVTNLLAVGLYHLFEQHLARIENILASEGRSLPELATFESWPKQVNELRLLANTIKHADGKSAAELREIRPDYFVDPIVRGSVLERWTTENPARLENPLGGTDLFVSEHDLSAYRDALRAFWEQILPDL